MRKFMLWFNLQLFLLHNRLYRYGNKHCPRKIKKKQAMYVSMSLQCMVIWNLLIALQSVDVKISTCTSSAHVHCWQHASWMCRRISCTLFLAILDIMVIVNYEGIFPAPLVNIHVWYNCSNCVGKFPTFDHFCTKLAASFHTIV